MPRRALPFSLPLSSDNRLHHDRPTTFCQYSPFYQRKRRKSSMSSFPPQPLRFYLRNLQILSLTGRNHTTSPSSSLSTRSYLPRGQRQLGVSSMANNRHCPHENLQRQHRRPHRRVTPPPLLCLPLFHLRVQPTCSFSNLSKRAVSRRV